LYGTIFLDDFGEYWMCPTLKQFIMVMFKGFAKNKETNILQEPTVYAVR
jgi:hypothetical protein